MKRQRIIFTALSIGLILAFAQFAGSIAEAQQSADPRVADLVKAGKLQFGLGFGNSIGGDGENPATGELYGGECSLGARTRSTDRSRFRGRRISKDPVQLSKAPKPMHGTWRLS